MAGDVQYFALKKLTGSPTKVTVAAKHNLREIQKELGANSHIDPLRTARNLILAGADTAAGVLAMYRDTLHANDIGKLRKDAVLLVECVVSLPAKSTIEPEPYFREALQWVRSYFGCPVISAVVHLDESAPHAHILILPLFDGKMNGSALVGNRTKLSKTQKDFHTAVSGKYGLRCNQEGKMSKALKYSSANLVLATLVHEPSLLNEPNVRTAMLDAIAASPVPIMDALGVALPSEPSRSWVEIMTAPAPEKRVH